MDNMKLLQRYIEAKAAPETVTSVTDEKHPSNETNNLFQDPWDTDEHGVSIYK